MTELRCDANEGLELITRSFWIDRDSTVAKAVRDGPRRPGGPAHLHHGKGRGGRRQGRLGRRRGQGRSTPSPTRGLRPASRNELSATLVDKATGEPVADASASWRPRPSSPPRLDGKPGRRDLLRREPARRPRPGRVQAPQGRRRGGVARGPLRRGLDRPRCRRGGHPGGRRRRRSPGHRGRQGKGRRHGGLQGPRPRRDSTSPHVMDKGTGEPFLDKDGNEVTARTPFEPEAPLPAPSR